MCGSWQVGGLDWQQPNASSITDFNMHQASSFTQPCMHGKLDHFPGAWHGLWNQVGLTFPLQVKATKWVRTLLMASPPHLLQPPTRAS